MLSRAWVRVLLVASIVGVLALVSNITSNAQLSAQADTWLTIRFTLSKLVNSGTVWGGLLVLAGWLVRRPVQAALAAVVAGEVALVVHYGLGRLLEVCGPSWWVEVYGSSVWSDNWYWFVAPLLLGPPLGLIGGAARRTDGWGLPARLVVPAGAVIEPFFVRMFDLPTILPASNRISSIVTGVVLLVAGVVGAVAVLIRWRRLRPGAGRGVPDVPAASPGTGRTQP